MNVDYAEQLEKATTIPDANIKPESLQIIKALSDRQIKTQNLWSADFIKDKGEGVVVLLHGQLRCLIIVRHAVSCPSQLML